MSILSASEDYAAGVIDFPVLERRIEVALLRMVGREHPVPPGWEPLPPCEHNWLDITPLGADERHEICSRCGHHRWMHW